MFLSSPTKPTDRATVRRGRIVAALLLLGMLGLVARLFQLQIIEHSRWVAAAASMQERTIELPPRRGTIFDRNGELLAFDVKAAAIAVDGINATEPGVLAAILSEELGIAIGAVNEKVYRSSYFTWVDRCVDLETAQRIERRVAASGAYGLIFIDTWKRCYPQGALASNVIGFVGTDGEGLEGLEWMFDESLRGTPTKLHVLEGADGRTYRVEVLEEGRPGEDLVLTIDVDLQFLCEEEIDHGVAQFRAEGGMIVVLDPRSGDVLAMAQDKTYDLNRFWDSTPEARRNLAVTHLFEPGSIFKVFTGLAALEEGVVDVDDTFNGDDGIVVAGHTMHNSEYHSYGTVTFAEIIEHSINTGMIQVAQRLGAEAFRRWLAEFGFGRATGIELPGEVDGILRPADAWSRVDLAAASIGQSVAVTGIQLASAMATVASDGSLITPRIVKSVGGAGGSDVVPGPSVVNPDTCTTMRELMRAVVESGTGTWAAIDGFDVAGKTGTAQKAVPGQGYVDGKYTSLFAGMFPVVAPAYVILVVLDEVKTTPVWGGYTAGQIFHEAASRLIRLEHLVPLACW